MTPWTSVVRAPFGSLRRFERWELSLWSAGALAHRYHRWRPPGRWAGEPGSSDFAPPNPATDDGTIDRRAVCGLSSASVAASLVLILGLDSHPAHHHHEGAQGTALEKIAAVQVQSRWPAFFRCFIWCEWLTYFERISTGNFDLPNRSRSAVSRRKDIELTSPELHVETFSFSPQKWQTKFSGPTTTVAVAAGSWRTAAVRGGVRIRSLVLNPTTTRAAIHWKCPLRAHKPKQATHDAVPRTLWMLVPNTMRAHAQVKAFRVRV